MWFNVAVARWINLSITVKLIGWTDVGDGYDADNMYARMTSFKTDKFFTSAYVICPSIPKDGEEEERKKWKCKKYNLAYHVFPSIVAVGAPSKGETLSQYHKRLTAADCVGDFMAGQIVADLKYLDPHLQTASDWGTFAPIGPGPSRFLARCYGKFNWSAAEN
jgi:hypothetical protein